MNFHRPCNTLAAVSALLILACSVSAAARREFPARELQLFRSGTRPDSLRLDADALQQARGHRGPLLVRAVPTPDGNVDLELAAFEVLSAQTRFMVGKNRAIAAPEVLLLRGHVAGEPHSSVFLALGRRAFGRIARPGHEPALLSDHPDLPGEVIVFRQRGSAPDAPPVAMCGVDGAALHDGAAAAGVRRAAAGVAPQRGLKLLEVAIDTDYEFFELFGDVQTAAEYVVLLYGAVSDLYMQDVDTRIVLTTIQLYDTNFDEHPYHEQPDPLSAFAQYWNANMSAVPRDVAQLLTGRRDLPYGGVAYLSALCGSNAYSVAGYLLGELPDPHAPSHRLWDFIVSAHELGHNCGTAHTHDYGIDACAFGEVQRGTIMSYCHTVSGGNGNIDPYFHAETAQVMRSFIASIDCVDEDCNANGTADASDIAFGSSTDANGNDLPDECEDCDGDGTRDDVEIAQGAADLNANNVPDGCEADCNSNDVPDDLDLQPGPSQDLYGDGVPDECDADCNGNGLSDYNEIQLDMSLDLDRNAQLDSCQDCDGDGVTDFEALNGASNLWVASAAGTIGQFHGLSGVYVLGGGLGTGIYRGLVVAPDGHVLVSNVADNRVTRFNPDGTNAGHFMESGAGGLSIPEGLALSPRGTLLVCSSGDDRILEFNSTSGQYVAEFVASGSGGLQSPSALTFGPDGNVYVASLGNDSVIAYDGNNGSHLGTLVAPGSGGLSGPRGLAFKNDGNLVVSSFVAGEILEYDGESGAFVGRFDQGGLAAGFWALSSPWDVRRGPHGHIYVSSGGNASIHMYHGENGAFMRSFYVLSGPNLESPRGFDFVPGGGADCNTNVFPDDCDVAMGLSQDLDGNGVPDECPFVKVECVGAAQCADVDQDGVRDDGCIWWACAGGACAATDTVYADMGGFAGACAPDLIADINDRFHALNCFADQNTLGNPGYPCEANPPSAFNVDAAGFRAPCAPDGVCDVNDAFASINAFDGTTTCSCAPAASGPSGGAAGGVGQRGAVRLSASADRVRPGALIDVDVFLETALDDLRGYQLHMGVRGGMSGTIELADLSLGSRSTEQAEEMHGATQRRGALPRSAGANTLREEPHKPRQNAGPVLAADWSAFNIHTQQMAAGLDTPGAPVRPGHLATFTWRVSPDAAGEFVIELLHDPTDPKQRTFLLPSAPDGVIELLPVAPLVIHVQEKVAE